MTKLTETPVLEDSGSDGTQIEANNSSKLLPYHPLQLPLSDTVIGMIQANPKAFGGESATTLLGGAFAHISAELASSKQELADLRRKHEETTKELTTALNRKDVLAERIDSFRYMRHFANLGITIGVAAISGSLQLFIEQMDNYAYFALAVGIVILIASWMSAAPKGSDK